jgi:hypothetical protein
MVLTYENPKGYDERPILGCIVLRYHYGLRAPKRVVRREIAGVVNMDEAQEADWILKGRL